jgi:preprotein translocase subunit SecB
MPKPSNKVIPEKIHIRGINVINFDLKSTDDYLDYPQKPQQLSIEMANEIAHNFEKNAARYRLNFKFVAVDQDREQIGLHAEIGIEFHFRIDNLDDFLKKDDDQLKTDASISIALMGIAYSTARGIVLEKTKNTFFDGIMLPVVDPIALLKESMEQTDQEE